MSRWSKALYVFMVMYAMAAATFHAFQHRWDTAAWAFIAGCWAMNSYIWKNLAMTLERNAEEAIKIIQVVLEKVDELEETGEWRVKE